MKVTREKFIKVSMSMEEYATINSMIGILDDIYYDISYDGDEYTRKHIEKKWAKQGLNFGIDDVLMALEILRDLDAEPLDTE